MKFLKNCTALMLTMMSAFGVLGQAQTDAALKDQINTTIRTISTQGGVTRAALSDDFDDVIDSKVSLLGSYSDPTWITLLNVSKLSGIIPPTMGGLGVANNSTLTLSGNFATTFVRTGITSVTFPTTGTLSTLAGTESLSGKTLISPIIQYGSDANGDILVRQSGFYTRLAAGAAGTHLTSNGAGSSLSWEEPMFNGTVTSVSPANGDLSIADQTTTPVITIVSAPKLSDARTFTFNGDISHTALSFDGSANVSATATVSKINGVSLAGLGTGILKNTTGTGVPSIAVAGDFPTLNQDTNGNAATVTTNANLSGHVNSVGNNTTLGSFTIAQLSTAISDANISGTNTGDQTITLTSDVTGSGTGSFATTIANDAVTLGKMANMATASLIYRKTSGTGDPEVQTLATLKTDLGLTGTNSGDQTISLTGAVTGTGTGSFATSLGSFTIAQLSTAISDANISGTNTGDQTSISGFSSTKAQFDAAASDGNFLWVGDAPTAHTLGSHSDVTLSSIASGELLKWNGSAWVNNTLAEAGIQEAGSYLSGATNSTQDGYFTGVRLLEAAGATYYSRLLQGSDLTANRALTFATGDADRTLTISGNTTLAGGTHSGTNTGDQTSISGITGTKAQFNTAVTDGDIFYTSDLGAGVATALAINTGSAGSIVTNTGTSGGLIFPNVGGIYVQDDANLHWDDSNNRLGIGATTPRGVLDLGSGTAGRAISWGGTTNNYQNIFTSFSGGGLVAAVGFRGNSAADTYESSYGASIARAGIRMTPFGSLAGTILFYTDAASVVADGTAITPTEQLRINNVGAHGLSGPNFGTSGQVMISNGSGAAPSWSSTAGISITGNAATVTTNANLTGAITSSGNATSLGSFTIAQLSTAISDANISGTNTGDQTLTFTGAATGSGTSGIALTLATPGTLGVASTNSSVTAHTHAITSSSAPGAAASLLATDASGHIGSTGTRIAKIWATDITATNAISGSVTGNAATVTTNANLTGHVTSVGNAAVLGSFTKSQLSAAVSDGDPLYVGDITQYTDELAQDAVGGMVDATIVYTDGTPLLSRAALTGDITASAGSNATAIAAGVIVNADINASAAIAYSKLESVTSTAGWTLTSNGTGPATFQAPSPAGLSGLTTGKIPYATSSGNIGNSEITRTSATDYSYSGSVNSSVSFGFANTSNSALSEVKLAMTSATTTSNIRLFPGGYSGDATLASDFLISTDGAAMILTASLIGIGTNDPAYQVEIKGNVDDKSLFAISDNSGRKIFEVNETSGEVDKIGLFGASPVGQQSVNAILTNSVTPGGSQSVIADYSSLTVYATDAATIRNNFYRLAEKVLKLETALRNLGAAAN